MWAGEVYLALKPLELGQRKCPKHKGTNQVIAERFTSQAKSGIHVTDTRANVIGKIS